jgi:hypothetical protein
MVEITKRNLKMKVALSLILILVSLSCGSFDSSNHDKFVLRKSKNEKNQTSNNLNNRTNKTEEVDSIFKEKNGRRIRFLYAANGGIRAYFNNGTIVGCPRCDLSRENIRTIYCMKPFLTYKYENGELIILENNEREYPRSDQKGINEGWVVVDYKWLITLDKNM